MSDFKDIYLSLEIKDNQDRLSVASILVANGYTVRLSTIKDGNKAVKVLQYKKER